MSDIKMTAEIASNELIDYRNLLMEDPSDSVIDTGTLMAKAMELFLKMEQANGVQASEATAILPHVSGSALLNELIPLLISYFYPTTPASSSDDMFKKRMQIIEILNDLKAD